MMRKNLIARPMPPGIRGPWPHGDAATLAAALHAGDLDASRIAHYTVLRTIEASYGLAGINNAASLSPILDAFN